MTEHRMTEHRKLEEKVKELEKQVSEHKRSLDHLTEQHNLIDTILDSLPGIFYIYNSKGELVRWNKNHEILTGYSPEELNKKTLADWFDEDDLKIIMENFHKGLVDGEAYAEANLIIKDGSKRPYFFTGRNITLEGDKYLLGMGVDLSDRKDLEEKLRQSQKMEALGTLAGGVAHDFKNLLTPILGYAEYIQMMKNADEIIKRYASDIEVAGRSANAITTQLLAFSRKQELHPVVTDLIDTLKDNKDIIRTLAGDTMEISYIYGSESSVVRVDPDALIGQVIVNLAVNARHATRNRGKLVISARNIELENDLELHKMAIPKGDYALLSVKDNGCGMDEETISKAFEPFFTTRKNAGGTGLGLSSVYGFVKQAGGYVSIDSEINKGTEVDIYLPLVDHFPESSENVSPVDYESLGAGKKVLVVDDKEYVTDIAGKFLAMAGFDVIKANSPGDALLESDNLDKLDLIVTDIAMPRLTGPEMAIRIRKKWPGAKVLYMSGYIGEIGEGAELESLLKNQGDSIIKKPVSFSSFVNKIKDMYEQH